MKKHLFPLLMAITAIGTVVYWVDFFLIDKAVKARTDQIYLAFESSFPLPDCWMAACLALAVIGFYQQKIRQWIFFGLMGTASMIFLSLIDVHFNINQGHYALIAQNPTQVIEAFINIWLLVLGSFLIRHFWKTILIGH